ncbi:discoidin domain-containing protein [Chitinophaga nivalis]|uniref:Discoidin domain-containing protein n=1 Tax=Chitinophaga nivalis TaxID=2991709 RepID=A0ABT3II99_9BACT|nr:discoidin domain-containing protein [Chitinophaga nivalis]MCW3466623.1 discoidin domain-containing protein [Chitinophaga nivalis]MCW3483686.1 discoidin domain-containing protein [Chitinophaga nivalis]
MKPLYMFRLLPLLFIPLLIASPAGAQTGTSAWVKTGSNGKLVYTPDTKGNTIPDFSTVGYHSGEKPIPDVPVVKTISPVSGDNLAHIQAAIDDVAALPLKNGFRGALLLKKGTYSISNTLRVSASGIVLRGEGRGAADTRLVATRTAQHTLITVSGAGKPTETAGTRKGITDNYVPIGAKSFNVESAAGFAAGDRIRLVKTPNDAWISLLGMAPYGWTTGAYTMHYFRTITAISGNKVTVDAPVVDPIDKTYGTGAIYKYTWPQQITEVGIENMRIESAYAAEEDENHGWTAITISNTENAWVRGVDAYYFGYGNVGVLGGSLRVTVIDCKMIDPKSQAVGGRKYPFLIDDGQLVLVRNCHARNGRHDYVTGSSTPGPNAFVHNTSELQRADNGPHHRWATGVLYDNVSGNGDLHVQNRKASGSGHGWAGSQCVFWNCTGRKFIVQQAPQHYNWAIGCKGIVTADGNWHDGNPGVWESINTFVSPQSLYEKQLEDRLGNVVPPCEAVAASSNDGNVPANVLDNNLNTRWSARGNGEWIQFCLNDTVAVSRVDIAFYNGNTRKSSFDIWVGLDGQTWTTAVAGRQSSGTSLALESFTFAAKTGRYVRIVGHGNNLNDWNSYTEVAINPSGAALNATSNTPEEKMEVPFRVYPNPFQEDITVSFHLKEGGQTQLGLYDLGGKTINIPIMQYLQAGSHQLTLTCKQVPAGMYVLRMTHKGKTSSRKISKL